MTFCKRTIIISLTWAAGLCIGDLARDQSIVSIPSFVSSAVAKVGRPLTRRR